MPVTYDHAMQGFGNLGAALLLAPRMAKQNQLEEEQKAERARALAQALQIHQDTMAQQQANNDRDFTLRTNAMNYEADAKTQAEGRQAVLDQQRLDDGDRTEARQEIQDANTADYRKESLDVARGRREGISDSDAIARATEIAKAEAGRDGHVTPGRVQEIAARLKAGGGKAPIPQKPFTGALAALDGNALGDAMGVKPQPNKDQIPGMTNRPDAAGADLMHALHLQAAASPATAPRGPVATAPQAVDPQSDEGVDAYLQATDPGYAAMRQRPTFNWRAAVAAHRAGAMGGPAPAPASPARGYTGMGVRY